MRENKILIVDDEIGMLDVYCDTLSRLSYVSIDTYSDSEKCIKRLETGNYDLLIADLKMPKHSGIDIMKIAREKNPNCDMLLITSFPTVESAIESMKIGACDYLTKPIGHNVLLSTVQRILDQKRLKEENVLLSRFVEKPFLFDNIYGLGQKMEKIFNSISKVSETDVDVLLQGESGTGKELVARSIHKRSSRINQRFVPIDCGAIPENLLESEFFGHEKGAFTSAEKQNYGLLEFAHKGTLFLDEVCELLPSLQAKLLRVLQERTFRRVGGKEEISVDIRIIAATNRDMEEEVKTGRFREDLFYRLNVMQIVLPPLRERQNNIPLLVDCFIQRYGPELGKKVDKIDTEALEILTEYSWPGNVRELQNAVKSAIIFAKQDSITLEDISDKIVESAGSGIKKPKSFFDLRNREIGKFEKEYLGSLLLKYYGDVREAAREAQIPRGTYYRLLKKYGMDPETFRER